MGSSSVDVSGEFARLVGKGKQTVKIALACFKDADFAQLDTPFAISAEAGLSAAFTNIQVVGGAGKAPDAVNCAGAK
jgi:beta-glucosidase